MAKNLKIEVKGTEINALDQSGEKYISLTDMLAVSLDRQSVKRIQTT
ncbi:MAG: hypothetical protein ACK46S_06720 [Bacteroidota bacterium]|jgi:UDP-3-O-acyl-N-acetylglucosamine deacetylase